MYRCSDSLLIGINPATCSINYYQCYIAQTESTPTSVRFNSYKSYIRIADIEKIELNNNIQHDTKLGLNKSKKKHMNETHTIEIATSKNSHEITKFQKPTGKLRPTSQMCSWKIITKERMLDGKLWTKLNGFAYVQRDDRPSKSDKLKHRSEIVNHDQLRRIDSKNNETEQYITFMNKRNTSIYNNTIRTRNISTLFSNKNSKIDENKNLYTQLIDSLTVSFLPHLPKKEPDNLKDFHNAQSSSNITFLSTEELVSYGVQFSSNTSIEMTMKIDDDLLNLLNSINSSANVNNSKTSFTVFFAFWIFPKLPSQRFTSGSGVIQSPLFTGVPRRVPYDWMYVGMTFLGTSNTSSVMIGVDAISLMVDSFYRLSIPKNRVMLQVKYSFNINVTYTSNN